MIFAKLPYEDFLYVKPKMSPEAGYLVCFIPFSCSAEVVCCTQESVLVGLDEGQREAIDGYAQASGYCNIEWMSATENENDSADRTGASHSKPNTS